MVILHDVVLGNFCILMALVSNASAAQVRASQNIDEAIPIHVKRADMIRERFHLTGNGQTTNTAPPTISLVSVRSGKVNMWTACRGLASGAVCKMNMGVDDTGLHPRSLEGTCNGDFGS